MGPLYLVTCLKGKQNPRGVVFVEEEFLVWKTAFLSGKIASVFFWGVGGGGGNNLPFRTPGEERGLEGMQR